MADRYLVWCGPDDLPQGIGGDFKRTIQLNSIPADNKINNVFIKYSNISRKIARDIPSLVLDLIEIGAYVYCADQTVTRGGKTSPKDGATWHRNFTFELPVRNPEVWNKKEVKRELFTLLSFLSDDHYDFRFRELTKDIQLEKYFEFDDKQPWFHAEELLLFS